MYAYIYIYIYNMVAQVRKRKIGLFNINSIIKDNQNHFINSVPGPIEVGGMEHAAFL